MTKQDKTWKHNSVSYQIADTGDYDGHYEITDGKILLITKDDLEEEDANKIVNALNDSGCVFEINDHSCEDYLNGYEGGVKQGVEVFKEDLVEKIRKEDKVYSGPGGADAYSEGINMAYRKALKKVIDLINSTEK